MLICADCGGECYLKRREEDDGVDTFYTYGSSCCFDDVLEVVEDADGNWEEYFIPNYDYKKRWEEQQEES